MAEAIPEPDFHWTFHRMGGLDQVEFKTGQDIRRLDELDPKLWVALSCPAYGLEFDQRTLTLIDTDHDGRIRIPEVKDATSWMCERLKDPDVLLHPEEALPLDVIDDSTDHGKRILATAKAILKHFEKKDASTISQEDVTQAVLHASEQTLNGDGILPPLEALDEEVQGYIQDALDIIGGVKNVSGEMGINREISDAFIKTIAKWREWNKLVLKAETPLGKATPECWDILSEIKPKIDDYFMRCELVAYSPMAQASLNLEDKPLTDETGLLEHTALAELPLSKAAAHRPLDMTKGLNPAWRGKVERFAQLASPLLSQPGTLTYEDWQKVQDALAPFAKVIAERPGRIQPECVESAPTKTMEQLDENRINQLLKGKLQQRFNKLAQEDADGPAASTDLLDMEKMVHYYLHLHRLLINFVNFSEFYDEKKSAAFQSGSLYIDGRSCHLCIPAEDIDAHSAVAKGSQMFLLYCECTCGKKEGEEPEKKNIVAVVTAGDSDLLVQNRNGVYVDHQGKDWDAKVVKVVSNPIDLWQAVLAPYKKVGGLITEQISKYASDKQANFIESAGKNIDTMTTQVTTGTAPKFDIGRNVGVFAAVGLALGAIGTAVGSIFNALLSMTWWQLPLLMVGLFVLISGPSVLLAWLKLRQRTLGPLLEASGWAINGRAALTSNVAAHLSSTAELPPNSHRVNLDPVIQLKKIRQSAFWIAVGVGLLGALGFLMYKEYMHEKETGQLAKVMAELKDAAGEVEGAEEPKAEDAGEEAKADDAADAATADAPEEAPAGEEKAPAEEAGDEG